ncbi:Uncharacterized protein SCF082_LOCUS38322 [Durusdinium trenchii]|uniref:Uncharacterized protein n=1 Tax=Durusdinium trenchii TaxID=1381693 RepID=A0ABP0Q043_9DINO
MDVSWASRMVADLRPPLHAVKVLPTKMLESERMRRTRAAMWIYGSSVLLTIMCLKLLPLMQRCCQRQRKVEAGYQLLGQGASEELTEEGEAKPDEDHEDAVEAPEEERAHRLTVGFVVYHMTYTYLGLALVFWACRKGYLNAYGMDWEIYSFWLIETIATHLICGASPAKFLSAIMPVLSERYDLVKDTVSIGIYANLGHPAGYACSAVVILTMIVPNIFNYMDPATEQLMRASYWPIPADQAQVVDEDDDVQQRGMFHRFKVFCAKQMEDTTREHRRVLCLLEDLPQLAVALFFTAYSRYTEGAAISPFIALNIVIAVAKTCGIFLGRGICLTWMVMNKVPWPMDCITQRNLEDVVWFSGYYGEAGEAEMLRVLKEVVRSDDTPRSLRQTAERHLWSRVEELQETYGFPFSSSESQFGVDLVQHAKGQRACEAVVAYCASKALSFQEASSMLSKWQVFAPINSDRSPRSEVLLTWRVLVEGSLAFESRRIGRDPIHLLAEPLKMLKSDSSEEEKTRAIILLGGMCTKEAARAVLSYNVNLSHADDEVRAAVCRSLAWASEDDFAKHSEALVRTAFEDENSDVRQCAWVVLGLKRDLGVKLVEKQLAQGNYADQESDLLLRSLFAVQWLGEDADVLWDDKVLQLIEDSDLWPARQDSGSCLRDTAETLLKCGRMDRLTNILPKLLLECKHDERGQRLVGLAAVIKGPKPRIVDVILQLLVSVTVTDANGGWLHYLLQTAKALVPEFNEKHVNSLLGVIEQDSSPVLLQLKASELLGELRKRQWDVSLPVSLIEKHFENEDTTVLTRVCAVLQAWGTISESLPLLPHLAKLLQHSNESVRAAAFETFGNFDAIPSLKPHIPALLAACLGTDPETGIFYAAFRAVRRLDIFSNDLVDEESKQKVLDSAHRLNDPDRQVRTRARTLVQLLPTDEIDSDLVKDITRTSFRKDDPLSFETFNLGQKGQAALRTLIEEKSKELCFERLLLWTIESIDSLQRDDPRAEALVYYMLNDSAPHVAAKALQRCFGKKTVELPGVAEALPAVAFKRLAPAAEWLDRRVWLALKAP